MQPATPPLKLAACGPQASTSLRPALELGCLTFCPRGEGQKRLQGLLPQSKIMKYTNNLRNIKRKIRMTNCLFKKKVRHPSSRALPPLYQFCKNFSQSVISLWALI